MSRRVELRGLSIGRGAKPRCGGIASQTYLYPAAVKAGVFEAVEERDPSGKVTRVRYFDANGQPVKRWGFTTSGIVWVAGLSRMGLI